MIANVAPRRADGGSSFGDLLRYMIERDAAAPGDQDAQASLQGARAALEAAQIHLDQLAPITTELARTARARRLSAPAQAIDLAFLEAGPMRERSGEVSCETSCTTLATAALEMDAVAAMNVKVKDAVYHFIVSWPENERPSDDEAFAAARHALDRLGMEDHQYVAAVHRDTDNVHVHVMANRVHPETYRAQDVSRDYFTLDRAMRECEIRFGRKHDNGPTTVVFRDGEPVVVWASEQAHAQGKRPKRAQDMERWSGTESFHTYVAKYPRQTIARVLKDPELTWDKLHGELAAYGLELRPKGRGLAVYAVDQDLPPVKASDVHEDLSAARLARRLGEFQPLTTPPKLGNEALRYRRGRELAGSELPTYAEPASDPRQRAATGKQREVRRGERAAARQALLDGFKSYRKAHVVQRIDPAVAKQRYAELASEHRQVRAQIRASMLPSVQRKARYSLAALEAAKKRAALRSALAVQREQLRADPANRRLTYREWVAERAQAGDEAAVAQLRGWTYADRRQAKQLQDLEAKVDQPGFAPANTVPPRDLVVLDQVAAHRVMRDGSVRYRVDKSEAFIDHGRVMRMADAADLNEDRILAMLIVAREKYGNRFSLTGTPAFREAALQAIAQHHLPIELRDATDSKRLTELREATGQKQRARPSRSP